MHWLREKYLNAGSITEADLGDAGTPSRAVFLVDSVGALPTDPTFTDVGWTTYDGLAYDAGKSVDGFRPLLDDGRHIVNTSTPTTFELKFERTGKNRAAWRANLRIVFGLDRVRGRRHRAMVRRLLGVGRLDNRRYRAMRLRGLHHLAAREARSALHAAYHARQRSRRRA